METTVTIMRHVAWMSFLMWMLFHHVERHTATNEMNLQVVDAAGCGFSVTCVMEPLRNTHMPVDGVYVYRVPVEPPRSPR
jgi:hypothetical protein